MLKIDCLRDRLNIFGNKNQNIIINNKHKDSEEEVFPKVMYYIDDTQFEMVSFLYAKDEKD